MLRITARAVLLLTIASVVPSDDAAAQSAHDVIAKAAAALPLRSIGPAVMGGRISDIAVHPTDRSTWYVAAGSGGLWKTVNAGTTWKPVFDDEASYSIGTVALDPNRPDVVWVGTGENVSGRHVGWGDGVYRSRNGGRSWERMGLETSQHIGRILVDPRDGDVVLVAAEGPLWEGGGERGVYRTTDGGATWSATLTIDENTGVTDMEFDPADPDVVYAAAYQRRRHVWGFMAGGAGSGIYKSTDGGASWRRLEVGLPTGDMGKIGLAVTPADPSLVYATIEAGESERGFYRSRDRGESWQRRNSYISGGTGPHYYQEIEASPLDADLVYQMDVFFQVTRDGGASFATLGTGREKHSDNHALWIDPDDGAHLLSGTDAGLYETFDEGATWRHFPNLPISQFYKLALSNGSPFYDILGGAQDLGTVHGPVRTTNAEGVRNEDWYLPMGADGYGVAIDPTDANTLYLMTQQGNIYRYDRESEEALSIQPQPEPGDAPERWNWDSPIRISHFDSNRLYFGSQRLWRSDDRGDSWKALSGDLTRDRNRYEMPYMGRVWSVDALHDNGAMSKYATLTTISESPVSEGVLYVGTDDGLVQVSEDAGATWHPAQALPGVPELAFLNDVEASLHDADVVFAAADAHKLGDFSPYLFRSDDRGRSWTSISGDLPDGTIVWGIEQDDVDPDLLFVGAEYGLYFSPDGGRAWYPLDAGVPTIPFRDLKLHRRDGDLVGATFGRGFYVLDDYTPLRGVADGALNAGATLFPVRDAWWYVPMVPSQALGRPTFGSTAWVGDNPPYGALFTYWLADAPTTAREERQQAEAGLREEGVDAPFPGYEQLRAEALETGPRLLLLVRDEDGEPVRWIEGDARKGLHRVSWDLRRPAPDPIDLSEPGFVPPWAGEPQGPFAGAGRFSVEMVLVSADGVESLGNPQDFSVRPVLQRPGTDYDAVAAFQRRAGEMMRRIDGLGADVAQASERLRYMRAALLETPRADPALSERMDALAASLAEVRMELRGDPARGRLNEAASPGIAGRVGRVIGGHQDTTQPPTETMRRNLEIAGGALEALVGRLSGILEGDLVKLEEDLAAAGAPWTPGRRLISRRP